MSLRPIDWTKARRKGEPVSQAPRPPVSIPVDEFIDACIEDGIITEQEGNAFIYEGKLPAKVLTVVNAGATPREKRRRAYKLHVAREVHRDSGLVLAMAAAYSLTDARLDALFVRLP